MLDLSGWLHASRHRLKNGVDLPNNFEPCWAISGAMYGATIMAPTLSP